MVSDVHSKSANRGIERCLLWYHSPFSTSISVSVPRVNRLHCSRPTLCRFRTSGDKASSAADHQKRREEEGGGKEAHTVRDT
jgi:hypothetical protein